MARTSAEPPQEIIAASPVWNVALDLRVKAEAARSLRDERHAEVLDETAAAIEAAVAKGAALQDVGTDQAGPLLGILPESVATACRRGRIPGARKVAGLWRIPVRTLARAS